MKLVRGMEVGLSPGDFVLDGDPVPFRQCQVKFRDRNGASVSGLEAMEANPRPQTEV